MHLKQQNQAKCYYLCWIPAKPLSSCPLGLAQQWSKAIQNRTLRAWVKLTPCCSQVLMAAPTPSSIRPHTCT